METSKSNKPNKIQTVLSKMSRFTWLFAVLFMAISVAFPQVFADIDGKTIILAILQVLYLITNVVGVIIILIGLGKLIMSWINDDGPAQQKAAQFIAVGIALVLARFVLQTLKIEDWIQTSFN